MDFAKFSSGSATAAESCEAGRKYLFHISSDERDGEDR